MSKNELSRYVSYRYNIKRQLLTVGLWPNEHASRLYRILPFIFLTLSICATCAIFGYVKIHFTNIAIVTKGLGMMGSYVAASIKMTWVIINRHDVRILHNSLDPHFSNLLSSPMSTFILKGCTTRHRLSWIFTFFVALNGIGYVVKPVIYVIYQHLHHIQPIQYMLVYPAAYPWTIDPPGFRYKIHFILELAATVALICITVGIDSLFTMYGFQMIGQFREMSYRVTHMGNEVDKKSIIRECVVQHQKMMKCRDILQKIYGPFILWIATTNAIILCSLMFQLTKTRTLGGAIFFAVYTMLKMVQTFMYAWTGACLTEASDDYREAVYNADWFGNKYFMSSVLITLTQKPLILTACNFSNVSLDLFTMVLNTTISYFFLLRTLEDNL